MDNKRQNAFIHNNTHHSNEDHLLGQGTHPSWAPSFWIAKHSALLQVSLTMSLSTCYMVQRRKTADDVSIVTLPRRSERILFVCVKNRMMQDGDSLPVCPTKVILKSIFVFGYIILYQRYEKICFSLSTFVSQNGLLNPRFVPQPSGKKVRIYNLRM